MDEPRFPELSKQRFDWIASLAERDPGNLAVLDELIKALDNFRQDLHRMIDDIRRAA